MSDALRFGFVTFALEKTATSAEVGVPPVQLPVVLKSVPVLLQVLVAPCAFGARSNMRAIRIVTMKKMAKARSETIGSWRRFAVRLLDNARVSGIAKVRLKFVFKFCAVLGPYLENFRTDESKFAAICR